ncbi:hypothetical protein JOQ06_021999, partial [Pogonophryne albipinna]
SSHAELMLMESRKTNLLGRGESLKRSGTHLPGNFSQNIHNLTHTWKQLENPGNSLLARQCDKKQYERQTKKKNKTGEECLPELKKILSEHSGPSSSSSSSQSANMNCLEVRGHGAAEENPRSALSPLTNALLEQLEARIKDLKAWLRDTELLIFNSCLGRETDAKEQLHSFKTGLDMYWLKQGDTSGTAGFESLAA